METYESTYETQSVGKSNQVDKVCQLRTKAESVKESPHALLCVTILIHQGSKLTPRKVRAFLDWSNQSKISQEIAKIEFLVKKEAHS